MKKVIVFMLIPILSIISVSSFSQALRIPSSTNLTSSVARKLGATLITVQYNAPGVKGREGKIWGTSIVPYGFTVLGFGSDVASPWRAGADECTTISFSTDVTVNGKKLAAGQYAFFMAVYQDSVELIFNKNTKEWGAYFYDKNLDILRVVTKQEKNQQPTKELLTYHFSKQSAQTVELALEWEYWRIPFTIGIDLKKTVLADIQEQLSGAIGFDPPSLEAGAKWCLDNDVNYAQALNWINSAVMPSLCGVNSFNTLSIKAELLQKLGKKDEAKTIQAAALENATINEMHQYGRRLLAAGKKEAAMVVFEKNYTKYKGAWPTNGGMMRGYAANGNNVKALEFAKLALAQAPDAASKKLIEENIALLEKGQPIK